MAVKFAALAVLGIFAALLLSGCQQLGGGPAVGTHIEGKDFAALEAMNVPLECSALVNWTKTPAKLFILGNQTRIEYDVGAKQQMSTVITADSEYIDTGIFGIPVSCKWVRFDYSSSSQMGCLSGIGTGDMLKSLPMGAFNCTVAGFGNEKFNTTSGGVCGIGDNSMDSIALMGAFPCLASQSDAKATQSHAYWTGAAKPFIIPAYTMSAGGNLTLLLQNMDAATLYLTNITVGDCIYSAPIAFISGESQDITLTGCKKGPSGSAFDLPVKISYSNNGMAFIQYGSKNLVGKYT